MSNREPDFWLGGLACAGLSTNAQSAMRCLWVIGAHDVSRSTFRSPFLIDHFSKSIALDTGNVILPGDLIASTNEFYFYVIFRPPSHVLLASSLDGEKVPLKRGER